MDESKWRGRHEGEPLDAMADADSRGRMSYLRPKGGYGTQASCLSNEIHCVSMSR